MPRRDVPEEELQRTKTPTCQHHSSPQPDYLDYLTADEPEAVAERVFVVFLRVFVTEIDSDSGRFGGETVQILTLKSKIFTSSQRVTAVEKSVCFAISFIFGPLGIGCSQRERTRSHLYTDSLPSPSLACAHCTAHISSSRLIRAL